MSETTVNRAYRLRQRPNGDLADGDLELVTEQVPELTRRAGAGPHRAALARPDQPDLDERHPRLHAAGPDRRGDARPRRRRGDRLQARRHAGRRDGQRLPRLAGALPRRRHAAGGAADACCPTRCRRRCRPSSARSATPAITAYIGIDLAELKEGETIVISAACGAVGSIAGQIAKERGAGASSASPAVRRSAATRSRSSATTPASTTAPTTGASSSTRRPPTASTSTSRTSAARSWTTS